MQMATNPKMPPNNAIAAAFEKANILVVKSGEPSQPGIPDHLPVGQRMEYQRHDEHRSILDDQREFAMKQAQHDEHHEDHQDQQQTGGRTFVLNSEPEAPIHPKWLVWNYYKVHGPSTSTSIADVLTQKGFKRQSILVFVSEMFMAGELKLHNPHGKQKKARLMELTETAVEPEKFKPFRQINRQPRKPVELVKPTDSSGDPQPGSEAHTALLNQVKTLREGLGLPPDEDLEQKPNETENNNVQALQSTTPPAEQNVTEPQAPVATLSVVEPAPRMDTPFREAVTTADVVNVLKDMDSNDAADMILNNLPFSVGIALYKAMKKKIED